ncbi:serine hydroxymethyltransferase [Endomicrobiia bacterium]|uniref:Serine hydroxymethyltransferase n=1 Tax=Endomicrobium trichonymphae TaxID=1408204 RepID=GLYA_ENDTX|nr:serine hydroxymethyltransferase [Candidatus Endomicrobium trichonymphae]B1GYQ9.1 RecName: Full=Serine hydroxymethyltransferase; Short=SHMT; Short=Serine methylase [Candidatus Endomicrobium trichonymphae]GHT08008.1 serine hydroxymethyltransferase [Endomicrobiia bacterium]BAG14152.1 serine hydroxymethyltransferase [Candidatus Endomicrobium trichonymphae]GHT17613.1 serine hydroxymethyltransferase [Endomicrobiia bacterium]GHT25464.1 serine hydroxymethyltransferase [Endomicrobiia bacterium]
MENIKKNDIEIHDMLVKELKRQRETIELIASENIASQSVMEAQGSCLTNKYAEGYPGKRYYGGCEVVDIAETIAIERAKKLFNARFANVQPHSGAQANFAILLALLKPGDTIMGLSLSHGGHLTHGSPFNVSGKWFNVISYSVSEKTGCIDYNEIESLVLEHKPKLIISGASAYSRIWDWERISGIAKKVSAYHMSDMAHYAGLVAAGIYPSPVGYADITTTTTHKTLRGPRGGLILTNNEELAKKINSAIFPGEQGGPLMHVIAAKAVAFGEALKPEFKEYQKQVLANAKQLAETLEEGKLKIVSGGTDSHMFLVDLRPLNVKGKNAQDTLEKAGITLNKNGIPYDLEKPTMTSGIRIGSPAVTTRGMKEPEMVKIAEAIIKVLKNIDNEKIISEVSTDMLKLCQEFPIYRGLEY